MGKCVQGNLSPITLNAPFQSSLHRRYTYCWALATILLQWSTIVQKPQQSLAFRPNVELADDTILVYTSRRTGITTRMCSLYHVCVLHSNSIWPAGLDHEQTTCWYNVMIESTTFSVKSTQRISLKALKKCISPHFGQINQAASVVTDTHTHTDTTTTVSLQHMCQGLIIRITPCHCYWHVQTLTVFT